MNLFFASHVPLIEHQRAPKMSCPAASESHLAREKKISHPQYTSCTIASHNLEQTPPPCGRYIFSSLLQGLFDLCNAYNLPLGSHPSAGKQLMDVSSPWIQFSCSVVDLSCDRNPMDCSTRWSNGIPTKIFISDNFAEIVSDKWDGWNKNRLILEICTTWYGDLRNDFSHLSLIESVKKVLKNT